ncbi:hypothetical protein GW932_04590 [archaeon]|nr:hypothetical protein [archaeon]
MSLVFRYKSLPGKTNDKKSPTLQVSLRGRSSFPIEVIALLDTGADVSVIPLALAELLNLDLNSEILESNGIGGTIKTKRSSMRVEISKNRESYSIQVPVEVALEDDPPIILGRNGFFDKFQIIIEENKHHIILKRNNVPIV